MNIPAEIERLNVWIEGQRPGRKPRTWPGVFASGLLGILLGLVFGLCAIQSVAL